MSVITNWDYCLHWDFALAMIISSLLGVEFAIGIFELILSMLGTGIIVVQYAG